MLFKNIQNYCEQRLQEFDLIPNTRQEQLKILSQYLTKKYQKKATPSIIVICTHNSRRSHLGQMWLAVGADFLGLPPIETYSGGTEATAFNPRAVAALQRVGFDINTENPNATNPKYLTKWSDEMPLYTAFSTKYDDAPNPTKEFAAIMVCTDADEKCPIVQGMDLRLPLPFDDPKAFDDTDLEAQMYSERCEQIAREFLFVLKNVVI